jgi:hypothetical protein
VNLYAESSAVLSWLLGQPLGNEVWQSLQGASGVFASELTLIETDRTLHRLTATGKLALPDAVATRARLESAASAWVIHRITPRVTERSRAAFPVEPIRSLDAIQLATALVLREIHSDLQVVSLDRRVRENAVSLGFGVVPAEP